jgi:hypothetical protein
VERSEQLLHGVEVEAGSRLVANVEGGIGGAAGELDALRLAAGKRRTGRRGGSFLWAFELIQQPRRREAVDTKAGKIAIVRPQRQAQGARQSQRMGVVGVTRREVAPGTCKMEAVL